MSRHDLRLLVEITLVALGVVVFGALSTGVVLAVVAVAGPVVGLIIGFAWVVLAMFVLTKVDEARGL